MTLFTIKKPVALYNRYNNDHKYLQGYVKNIYKDK